MLVNVCIVSKCLYICPLSQTKYIIIMETSVTPTAKSEILRTDIFNRIIASDFDPDNSTPEKISLIYEIDGFRLEISYDGQSDIEIEEVCYFDGKKYVEYQLTEEQLQELTTIVENYREGYMDEVADSTAYQKDVYAYHGMRRSDFF